MIKHFVKKKYVIKTQAEYRNLYAHAYLNTLNIGERNENLLSSFRLGVENGWFFTSPKLNLIHSELDSIMSHSSGENEFILSSLIDGFAHQKLAIASIIGCLRHFGNFDQFYNIIFRRYEEGSIDFQTVFNLVLSNDIFQYNNYPHILSRFYAAALNKHREQDTSSEGISELFMDALKNKRKIAALTSILPTENFPEEIPYILAHLLTKEAPVKIKSYQVSYFLRSVHQSAYDFYSLAISKYLAEEISLEDLSELTESGKTNFFQNTEKVNIDYTMEMTMDQNMLLEFDRALESNPSEKLSQFKTTIKLKLEQEPYNNSHFYRLYHCDPIILIEDSFTDNSI